MKFQVVFSRFVKGFWSSGLAAVAVELAQNSYQVSTLADLSTLGWAVVTGFVTGGILGVLKFRSWRE